MSMLSIHQAALESSNTVLHEFLLRYKIQGKIVYGFVEGKDDPSFYQSFIEGVLPQEWDVELFRAGGKDKVLEIYNDLDWSRFSKKRIAFFTDTDLSHFTSEPIIEGENIYTTDKYSIENSIVNRRTCKRILTEICGFEHASHDEIDKVLDVFDREVETFLQNMIEIMAWIVYWKKHGEKPCLNDICMNHLFKFDKGNLVCIKYPKKCKCRITYIHKQCNILFDAAHSIEEELKVFKLKKNYRNYTRGKYLMWFLVNFCLSIYHNYTIFFNSLTKNPKLEISFSDSNGMVIAGPRARCPDSLHLFIKNTYLAYVKIN